MALHLPHTIRWVLRCVHVIGQLEVEVVIDEVAPEEGWQQNSRVRARVPAKVVDAPLLEHEIGERRRRGCNGRRVDRRRHGRRV